MFERDKSVPFPSFMEIERQAGLERDRIIRAYVRGTARAFGQWIGALIAAGTRLVGWLAAESRRRRAIRELHRLDDRTLADIGLSRSLIEYTVSHGRPAMPAPSRRWSARTSDSTLRQAA